MRLFRYYDTRFVTILMVFISVYSFGNVIDGPANCRDKPNGKVIISIPDREKLTDLGHYEKAWRNIQYKDIKCWTHESNIIRGCGDLSLNYTFLDVPAYFPLEHKQALMISDLDFYGPSIMSTHYSDEESENMLKKSVTKHSIHFSPRLAFWSIPGEKESLSEVMILIKPELFKKPNGAVTQIWSTEIPVRVYKSYQGWRLIYHKYQGEKYPQECFGWVPLSHLSAIPQNRIYVLKNGNIAKSFPKSFNDWLNLKNELVTLSGLKTSASCPRNITKEEEDGVWFVGKGHDMSFDENQINQKVLDTVRSEAIGNCEIGKNRTKVLISKNRFPNMTSLKCSCLSFDPLEDSSPQRVDTTQNDWRRYSTEDCYQLKYFFSCFYQPKGEEGNVGHSLSCPIDCFKLPNSN